jgi:hypothetical protein
VELAKENTRGVVTVLAQGSRAVKPLDGESLSLVREGLLSLLVEQKRLRAWLRDQQTNYEYQVGVQRKQIETLHNDAETLQGQLRSETAGQDAVIEAHRQARDEIARIESERAQTQLKLTETAAQWEATKRQLDDTEKRRREWEGRAGVLEREKADLQKQLAEAKTLHEGTVADWTAYANEMDRKLAEYRGQRAWRGMLALRKAYVLRHQQGWGLRLIPWGLSVLRGGGEVESEQLEFPVRPVKRDK